MPANKIILTGGKGMLGRTLQRVLTGYDIVVADLPDINICDAAAFNSYVADIRPAVIIHCASMTNVDKCESDVENAFRINAAGSANVAVAAHRNHARLIAFSTDYVFGGESTLPYNEFDTPEPHTIYGKSKLAGEQLIRQLCPEHLILRLAWLYGPGGPSFIHTILRLANERTTPLTVVNDQHGNPTSTDAVANGVAILLKHPELAGTFHFTCEGEATWFELAVELLNLTGHHTPVTPCTTKQFPRPAQRPANSRLDNLMLRLQGLQPMPDWHDALASFLQNEGMLHTPTATHN